MHRIPLESCFEHADLLRGGIVLITGGGSGFGSALAVECARFGAFVVIADINPKTIQETISKCQDVGGTCTIPPALTDVTSIQAQEAMFQYIVDSFGRAPDIVFVNAGVSMSDHNEDDNELKSAGVPYPKRINLATYEINLQGALTTAELAQHYWAKSSSDRPRRLILVGSMAGYAGIAMGSTYTMSKHCVTGYWKALTGKAEAAGFACHLIAPYFSPTPILDKAILSLLAGYATVEPASVMKAMFQAASDPSPSSGKCYLLVDHANPIVIEAAEYSPLDSRMIASLETLVMKSGHPAASSQPTWGATCRGVAQVYKKTPVVLAGIILAILVVAASFLAGSIFALNRLPVWTTGGLGIVAALPFPARSKLSRR